VAAKKKIKAKRQHGPPKKGLELVGVRLEEWQNRALLEEAQDRARATGSGVNDKSAVIREALMLHPAIKSRRPKA